ncbi:MAG: hypothetical protein AAGJ52_12940, partial [Pseudomonadota bacterium]
MTDQSLLWISAWVMVLGLTWGPVLPVAAGDSQPRFRAIDRATVHLTGNTLGLSGAASQNGPGIRDSVHTFIAAPGRVDNVPSNPANPWFDGTTFDWTDNESMAMLQLPSGSEVLYAELIWGGSFNYAGEDVSANLEDSITLTTPAGPMAVAPDPATGRTISLTAANGLPANYYLRSAEVTQVVIDGGSGAYAVGAVPGTQNELSNNFDAAGWSLIVVVRRDDFACQRVQFDLVGTWIDKTRSTVVSISELNTPAGGSVTGSLLTGALEGDVNFNGDSLSIREAASANFVALSTPGNPADNFYASQINDRNGNLDSSGSFGNRNHDAQSASP